MTYEQYWYEDVLMVRAFREADKLRQRRMNEEAWWLGGYFARAIESTIGNAFLPKGASPSQYPERPIPLTEEEKKRNDELEAERERQRLINYLNRMVATDRITEE